MKTRNASEGLGSIQSHFCPHFIGQSKLCSEVQNWLGAGEGGGNILWLSQRNCKVIDKGWGAWEGCSTGWRQHVECIILCFTIPPLITVRSIPTNNHAVHVLPSLSFNPHNSPEE